MAKRALERDQHDRRGDADLEELKRALRERAAAISVRERELDRAERKLALRERRIGRRLRALRAERSWFTPVRNRRGGGASPGQADQLERMRADLARREGELAARAAAARTDGERQFDQRSAELDLRAAQLAESERELSQRSRDVDVREIAVATLAEREAAADAAAQLAAERERLLEERERQLGDREASLTARQAEVEEREREAVREPDPDPVVETSPEERSELEQRAAALEGAENRIAEREAALEERATTLTEIEQSLTRLRANVEQDQQAAAETLRTIESREQDLARAQANLESRSAAVAEREERAARERATPQPRPAQPQKPPAADTGFLAGLDAMASASNERRSRRDQR